jgi:acetylornithine deacetylase
MEPTIKLLADLVAIESINPSLVPGGAGENDIAIRIEDEMRASSLDVERVDVVPGRPNVVGILEGRKPGRSLMYCGHIDTVGVAGMTDPFNPLVKDGRLFGRGSEDMKGGVAAMISAARNLAQSGGLQAGRLLVAAVADEEYASLGAEALTRKWRADAAVVTEPTHLRIATGHRGFTWMEVIAKGRAAHGSRPAEGRDAIFRMGRVLRHLERLDRELQSRPSHAIMGTASLHASMISGGRELSTYPDHCALQMERRSVAGENGETALAEIESILAALREEDPELQVSSKVLFDRLPYETPAQHFIAPALAGILRNVGLPHTFGGTSFWTDAAVLGHAGIPCVIFGPGGSGLHGPEEYVEIAEVLSCRDALIKLALEICR